jgi:hypothetical protein
MSFENVFTVFGNKKVFPAIFAALLIVFGSASASFAQEGNQYEEPWFPAARFAAKEGGKREKATITLVKVENASFQTGEKGLTFQICMAVNVKKGRKKTVKRYAQTTVFRNDKTMAYMLMNWTLVKTPPQDCQ